MANALADRPPNRRAAGGLLVAWILFQVVVAWYPFELDPPRLVDNAVSSAADGSLRIAGDHVRAVGVLPGPAPDSWEPARFHVDLLVQPATAAQSGPARILAVSEDTIRHNLMVGQDGADLVVRVRRPGSDPLGRPAFTVPDVFAGADPVAVQVTVGEPEITVLVDGELRDSAPLDGNPFATWDPAYPLSLGDEPQGGRVWNGQIFRATVTAGGDTVDYLAPRNLERPQRIWYLPDHVQESLGLPSPSAARRSILHLGSLAVLGVLAVAYYGPALRPRSLAVPVLTGSLLVQVGKLLIAGRHPSLLDVGAHVVGAVVGAAAAARVVRSGWLRGRSLS